MCLHHAEGFLNAQEHAGQIDVDDALPVLDLQILEQNSRRVGARVIKDYVDPAVGVRGDLEHGLDRVGVGHVRGLNQGAAAGITRKGLCFLQHVGAAAGEGHRIAVGEQRQGRRPANAGAGAGDDGDLGCRNMGLQAHGMSP